MVKKLRPFYWRGKFCLLLELQRGRVCVCSLHSRPVFLLPTFSISYYFGFPTLSDFFFFLFPTFFQFPTCSDFLLFSNFLLFPVSYFFWFPTGSVLWGRICLVSDMFVPVRSVRCRLMNDWGDTKTIILFKDKVHGKNVPYF